MSRPKRRQELLDLINAYCEADTDDTEQLANGLVEFVAQWIAGEWGGSPWAISQWWREDMEATA